MTNELWTAELSIRARGARGNSRRRADLRRGPPRRAAGVVGGSRRGGGLGEGAPWLRRGGEADWRGKEQSQRRAAQAREAPRAGALSGQHLLRGGKLHRPHGRDGARPGQGTGADDEGPGREALAFRQDFQEFRGRARLESEAPGVLAEGGLGSRARSRDREDGEVRSGRE